MVSRASVGLASVPKPLEPTPLAAWHLASHSLGLSPLLKNTVWG